MYTIVDNFAQLVSTPPDPVILASRVGARKPSTPGDLPAMVISLAIDDQRSTDLGRVMRSGESITRTSAIVQVSAIPNTFSSDLSPRPPDGRTLYVRRPARSHPPVR